MEAQGGVRGGRVSVQTQLFQKEQGQQGRDANRPALGMLETIPRGR